MSRPADDYDRYFIAGEKVAILSPCPCCGAGADVTKINGCTIICSRHGCRQITAGDYVTAAQLWNEPDFRKAHPIK